MTTTAFDDQFAPESGERQSPVLGDLPPLLRDGPYLHDGRHTREIMQQAAAEIERLRGLVDNPITADFLAGVQAEAAHQVLRWGVAHDRSKSAENWFWLVGYLAGKCLRSSIAGDREKALHHTISAAAALAQWHAAILADTSDAGVGVDADLAPLAGSPQGGAE